MARHLIDNYTFTPGTRKIVLPQFDTISKKNLRLIINETQKFIICSSMQKDLITVTNNEIEYSVNLPTLEENDELTVEVDMGDDVVFINNDYIISKKLDSLKPLAEQETWVFTDAMAREVKPLIEMYNGSYECGCLFEKTNIVEADLSSWIQMNGTGTVERMFANCNRLTTVKANNLKNIIGANVFANCKSLVNLQIENLEICTNNFISNAPLQEFIAPNLKSLSNCHNFINNCSSLRKVYIPNVNDCCMNTFSACGILEMHIGCGGLYTQGTSSNWGPFVNISSEFSDLYLYGTPSRSLYIRNGNDMGKNLSYDSVLRVLNKANEVTCSGWVVEFSPNLRSYTVSTQQEKIDFDNLFDEVQGKGWRIMNLSKDKVTVEQ